MADREHDSAKPGDDLRARIEALDPCALDLLGVLGLENTAISRQEWRTHATRRGVRNPSGEALKYAQVDAIAEHLNTLGLVVLDINRRERTPSAVTLATLDVLHARARLEPLAEPERTRMRERGQLRYWGNSLELATSLRVAAILLDAHTLQRAGQYAAGMIYKTMLGDWLLDTLGVAPSPAAVQLLPAEARDMYLGQLVTAASTQLLAIADPLIELALALNSKPLNLEIGRLLILRGRSDRALELCELPAHGAEGLSLLAAFWAGDHAEAARIGGDAIARMKTRKRKYLPGLDGICHVLAGLATSGHDPRALESVESLILPNIGQNLHHDEAHTTLAAIHGSLLGVRHNPPARVQTSARPTKPWFSTWLAGLHDVWLGLRPKTPGSLDIALALLREWSSKASDNDFGPVARELEATIAALADPDARPRDSAPSLATAFRAAAPWEAALNGLEAIVAAAASAPAEQKSEQRLCWQLEIHAGYGQLTPRLRASARARKGQVVPLSRLLAGEQEGLDDDDRRVVAAIEPDPTPDYYRSRGRSSRSSRPLLLGPRSLVAVIGHPRVIDENGTDLQVVRGQPRLRTKKTRNGARVLLEPRELELLDVFCQRDGDRVEIFERTPALERMVEILGHGLDVPELGLERLGRTLARLCVAASVEVEGDLTPEAEHVVADPRPTLLLAWDGEILSANACVAPLGLAGPHLRPGVGNPAITAELREHDQLRLVRGERELTEERRRFDEFERACPTLLSYASGPLEWRVPALADSLEAMLELGRLGDTIVIAWPQGRSLRPPSERDLDHLKLAVSGQRDWLGVDVQLDLDEGEVLSFQQMLDSRAGTRFIRLDGDRFVALSEQLRRRLDALEQITDRKDRKRDRLRASPAMLPVLDELTADLHGASFDPKALTQLQRARELANAKPRRPRGFAAELRDYQADGFTWMWRLAEAGIGACLADDMGLGKTVQALALLCQRANKGPALVVCPTSVVINWTNEAARFAPNLRTTILATSGDRAAALAELGRRDVLVCSYGVLASEAEALASVEFATAIFDEAHALKNEQTNRARAARSIKSDFRLGLTGTPVENRVDELWSLFAVLTPGLLGSKADFDERFAKPIARGDRERTAQLRTLLRHFILRRTKNQVLDELPARTEITLRVQPRPDERAYYEALRRRAVEAVERGDPRKKRFRILAEITRLRQAAVDPRLIDPNAAPSGAKIDALLEQLLALREEGHRALVFTQFLGSMAVLRERFAAAKIEYLELDGSTPTAERARRVDAFQAGEADVFMLSLRAGGVGMNLTGADYVLHLDPWWNPAVEDQATDRAHRIGQTRPVTVYRFITEGSIEEKILALHQSKRELADDVLTGLEGAQALDLEALMSLLV